jgi:ABC-type amino acid transport substrate-binding protein
MSTVGYGDKVPRTVVGKLIGIVWMFVTVATLGTLIASLSSAITVSQLQSPIRGPEDLHKARVATIAGTTSERYLRQNRIAFRYAASLDAALRSAAEREVDAVVYDAPLLRYVVTRDFQGRLDALPRTFGRQDYCIALPTGSLLREPINRVLLAEATQARLRDIVFRYLEQPPPPPRPQGDE